MKITHKLAKLPGTSRLRTIIMVTCTTPFLWLLFTNDFITLINIFPLMMMSGMFVEICDLSSICHETPESKPFNDELRAKRGNAFSLPPANYRLVFSIAALLTLPLMAIDTSFLLTSLSCALAVFICDLKKSLLHYIVDNNLHMAK